MALELKPQSYAHCFKFSSVVVASGLIFPLHMVKQSPCVFPKTEISTEALLHTILLLAFTEGEKKSPSWPLMTDWRCEDMIDQLFHTMGSGPLPPEIVPLLSLMPLVNGGSFWLIALRPLPHRVAHSGIERDPIRPFHMVAPQAMEASPWPIHRQTQTVKSNQTLPSKKLNQRPPQATERGAINQTRLT